jgi:hypothetical protein
MNKTHSKTKMFSSFDHLKAELFPDLTLEEATSKKDPASLHLWIDLANSSVDSLIQQTAKSSR